MENRIIKISFEEAEKKGYKIISTNGYDNFKSDLEYYDLKYDNSIDFARNIEKFKNDYIDILDDDYIILKENVTKDNIHLYYEFMSDEQLRHFIVKFEDEFSNTQDDNLMDIVDTLESRLQELCL